MCISATVYNAKFAYRLAILSIPGSPFVIIIITTIIIIIKYIAPNRVMQLMRCSAAISCWWQQMQLNSDVSSPNPKLWNHLGDHTDQPPNEQIHVRLLGLLMCIVLCNLVPYCTTDRPSRRPTNYAVWVNVRAVYFTLWGLVFGCLI